MIGMSYHYTIGGTGTAASEQHERMIRRVSERSTNRGRLERPHLPEVSRNAVENKRFEENEKVQFQVH